MTNSVNMPSEESVSAIEELAIVLNEQLDCSVITWPSEKQPWFQGYGHAYRLLGGSFGQDVIAKEGDAVMIFPKGVYGGTNTAIGIVASLQEISRIQEFIRDICAAASSKQVKSRDIHRAVDKLRSSDPGKAKRM